ncbi:DNA-binding XRE family transcriptional regulator [Brassicibacter mesophilus]
MFFYYRNKNKTIKELRKNCSYTAKELAEQSKLKTSIILKIDNTQLKYVPEPIKSKLIPILRKDNLDKNPYLP